MRKLAIWAIVVGLIVAPTLAEAAILNVSNARYVVTYVDTTRHSFGVDLEENGPKETRSEVRLSNKTHCQWVDPTGQTTELPFEDFITCLHKGTVVKVSGGRDWDNNINASEVWGRYSPGP